MLWNIYVTNLILFQLERWFIFREQILLPLLFQYFLLSDLYTIYIPNDGFLKWAIFIFTPKFLNKFVRRLFVKFDLVNQCWINVTGCLIANTSNQMHTYIHTQTIRIVTTERSTRKKWFNLVIACFLYKVFITKLSQPQRQHNTTSTQKLGWTRKWLCKPHPTTHHRNSTWPSGASD